MREKVPLYEYMGFCALNQFKLHVWQKQVIDGRNPTMEKGAHVYETQCIFININSMCELRH